MFFGKGILDLSATLRVVQAEITMRDHSFVTIRMDGPFAPLVELDSVRIQNPHSVVSGKVLVSPEEVTLRRKDGEDTSLWSLVDEAWQNPVLRKQLQESLREFPIWQKRVKAGNYCGRDIWAWEVTAWSWQPDKPHLTITTLPRMTDTEHDAISTILFYCSTGRLSLPNSDKCISSLLTQLRKRFKKTPWKKQALSWFGSNAIKRWLEDGSLPDIPDIAVGVAEMQQQYARLKDDGYFVAEEDALETAA